MRALLSVYDKTGLIDFARGLAAAGVERGERDGGVAPGSRPGLRAAFFLAPISMAFQQRRLGVVARRDPGNFDPGRRRSKRRKGGEDATSE